MWVAGANAGPVRSFDCNRHWREQTQRDPIWLHSPARPDCRSFLLDPTYTFAPARRYIVKCPSRFARFLPAATDYQQPSRSCVPPSRQARSRQCAPRGHADSVRALNRRTANYNHGSGETCLRQGSYPTVGEPCVPDKASRPTTPRRVLKHHLRFTFSVRLCSLLGQRLRRLVDTGLSRI